MNVLMISPGFPVEQPFFTRGLARQGIQVIGLGDQHENDLPAIAKQSLSAYLQVPSFGDSQAIFKVVSDAARKIRIDRIECTWEPYMVLAAQLREVLRLPGMTVEQTIPFRDKEKMKQVLDRNGIEHRATKARGQRMGFERPHIELVFRFASNPLPAQVPPTHIALTVRNISKKYCRY